MDSVGKSLDGLITSKEELAAAKLAMEQEINRHLESIQADATKQTENELKDIADARDANVKIQESDKASWLSKNVAYMLDLFVSLVWGGLTVTIVLKTFRLVGADIDWSSILAIYSTVTATFMVCLNFHRGTSRGSENKQKQLDKMYAGK